jgi:hypothetical protein
LRPARLRSSRFGNPRIVAPHKAGFSLSGAARTI